MAFADVVVALVPSGACGGLEDAGSRPGSGTTVSNTVSIVMRVRSSISVGVTVQMYSTSVRLVKTSNSFVRSAVTNVFRRKLVCLSANTSTS